MWRKEKMKKVTGIITTIKRRPKFSTQQCLLRKKTSWITTIMAKTKRYGIRIQIKAAFIGSHLLHAHILSTMIIKIGRTSWSFHISKYGHCRYLCPAPQSWQGGSWPSWRSCEGSRRCHWSATSSSILLSRRLCCTQLVHPALSLHHLHQGVGEDHFLWTFLVESWSMTTLLFRIGGKVKKELLLFDL